MAICKLSKSQLKLWKKLELVKYRWREGICLIERVLRSFTGTLGSNLTIAGAPALFVAKSMADKEDQRKTALKEFLSISVPYVTVSLLACYVPAMLIWVLPFAK